MRKLAIVLLLLAAPAAQALEECSEVAALDALYGVRDLLIRGASSYTVSSAIDEALNDLRGPLAGGGHRWVQFVRPSGTPPTVKREYTVAAIEGKGSPDSFEASADNPFAVAVVVPKKRSLFSANTPSWVGAVEISFTLDGEPRTRIEEVNAWLNPGTSRTFDLGTIADRAEVRIEASTSQKNAGGKTIVEIHFRQAVEQDDPENPQYETVRALQRIRSSSSPEVLDAEIAKLEHRLFPSLHSYPFTLLIAKTRDAEALLRSEKTEDQEKGRKLLKEVVEEVKE
ncbi:MAG: hypothetical protein ACSLFQ_00990 [Thermoanaerobaculia bacterium]